MSVEIWLVTMFGSSLSFVSDLSISVNLYFQAARDFTGLKNRGITAVVNCTTNIECFHKGSLDYFVFDVAFWRREVLGRYEMNVFVQFTINN